MNPTTPQHSPSEGTPKEGKLLESGEVNASIQSLAKVGGWEYHVDSQTIYWTEETYRIHETSACQHSPTVPNGIQFYAPESRPVIAGALARAVDFGEKFDLVLELITARGNRLWVRVNGKAERKDSRTTRVFGAIQDITEFQLSRFRLAESRDSYAQQSRMLKTLLDNLPGVAYRASANKPGHLLFVSEACGPISGYSPAELTSDDGSLWNRLIFEEDLDRFWSAILEARFRRKQFETFYRIRSKSGDTRWISDRGQTVFDESHQPCGVEGILLDVTDRKELEERHLRAQRLDSLGELAGSVAHDLNNILAPILMSAELLSEDPSPEVTLEAVRAVKINAARGANIVRQILGFVRGSEEHNQSIIVSELANEVRTLVNETFPKDIHLVVEIASGILPLRGDRTQIFQVLLNLLLNARDAMPEGGKIALLCDMDAGMVRIRVRDEGLGIDPANASKIFEPFFTTKETGRGTGIGLSTARSIAEAHSGTLELETTDKKGACFCLKIPPGRSTLPIEIEMEPMPSMNGQGLSILIVDDEILITQVLGRALEVYGFDLLLAESPNKGIALMKGLGKPLDLVITDILMPDMDGLAFARQLREMKDAIPILLISGLPESRVSLDGLSDVAFLQKPFSIQTLALTVKRLLWNS